MVNTLTNMSGSEASLVKSSHPIVSFWDANGNWTWNWEWNWNWSDWYSWSGFAEFSISAAVAFLLIVGFILEEVLTFVGQQLAVATLFNGYMIISALE